MASQVQMAHFQDFPALH